MLNTKIQPQSFFSSGEEVFYYICAWQPSCSMARNRLTKLSASFRQKIVCEICREVYRRIKKDFTILYMYIAHGQGQITSKS